jgi:flagellar basal body rod protein FlgC
MSSITSIGIAGMRAAEARFETAASNIVRGGTLPSEGAPEAAPEADLASSMVALKLASYDFKASAKIVEVGREMSRSVLDILA